MNRREYIIAHTSLSDREANVALGICLERGDKEIAHDLQLSETTTKYVIRTLMRRFGVRSRVGIALTVASDFPELFGRVLAARTTVALPAQPIGESSAPIASHLPIAPKFR